MRSSSRRLTMWMSAALVTYFGSSQAAFADYCATKPPPEGLVARCQGKTLVVPDSVLALRFQLANWMGTCAISKRAGELIYSDETSESIDTIWDLMKDLPSQSRVVRVVPSYEPLTYRNDEGRRCYGVKSVVFDLQRQHGEVEEPGPEVFAGPTDDMIKAAALAAKKVLQETPDSDVLGFGRFLGVVDSMAERGIEFDDTYYPVAPTTNAQGNFYACFKDYRWRCLPPDEALKSCENHLARDLVLLYDDGRSSKAAFTQSLLNRAHEIYRSFQYLDSIGQATDWGSAVDRLPNLVCSGGVTAISRDIRDRANKGLGHLYGHY